MFTDKRLNLLYLAGFIAIAILTRLVPHPWNFTAIGALSLLGGREFKKASIAIAVPILAMFLSDLILGLYTGIIYTYTAIAIIGLIAWLFKSQVKNPFLPIWSLFSSILFYLISNFGVWQSGEMYPNNLSGLISCLEMGIPFLKGQVFGDMLFTGIVFFIWDKSKLLFPVSAKNT